MPIILCTVTQAEAHPNADRLRVYTVSAPGIEPTVVVANTDNIYQVGDVVATALIGTVLSDGTVIQKQKVRGVLSFGMLLGQVDGVPGTDVSVRFGATTLVKQVDESQGVVEESAWPRYTSLDSYLRVRADILACVDVVVTEKSHGSSARYGFTTTRPYVVGTHTSRVVDARLDPNTWPAGHLIRKTLEWGLSVDMPARLARYQAAHPNVHNFAIYGETCGWKCSDLHYGRDAESPAMVRLFGEVTVNGKFLDWDDAVTVLTELGLTAYLLPILYRGKPDEVMFKRLRDQPSELAAELGVTQISEGVVIRPTKEAVSTTTVNRLVVKYKSPLYEERKSLRDRDPADLPVYVTAYDLIADFITEERVRHVIAKAEASGMVIGMRQMRDLGGLLYDDVRKESVGEWPASTTLLDEGTLRRWTFDLAAEIIARVVAERA